MAVKKFVVLFDAKDAPVVGEFLYDKHGDVRAIIAEEVEQDG